MALNLLRKPASTAGGGEFPSASAFNGMPPIGSILPYAPGYFAATANGGGWTQVGPSANTVAAMNTYLPGNWRVMNGAAPNDPESPIFNTASRFLPDLTSNRFLRGNTAAGAVGGGSVTLIEANLPPHAHAMGAHAHTMDHDHGSATSGGVSQGHVHDMSHNHTGGSAQNPAFVYTGQGGSPSFGSQTLAGSFVALNTFAGNTGGQSQDHTHNVDLPNYTGNTGGMTTSPNTGNGAGASTPVDITPVYLNVFFIMRIK